MSLGKIVWRYKWSIMIVLVAAGLWRPAFNYLVEFRPADVPFVTTPEDVVAPMLDLAEVTADDTVYDLGAGDGRIVIAAARDRGAKAVGVEIDPELAERANEAIRAAGVADRAKVRRGDMFKQDLSSATVVTLYLKPTLNAQLRPQLEQLRPGARVVSHWFSMPGAKPAKKITVKSAETGMEHLLYLWVAPIEWEE
jgi:protein-L-isoaspartate O-methyltransferase